MKPVRFVCRATLPLPPEQIAAQILDLSQWSSFTGYGPLPGVKHAEFACRTPEVVGSHIAVVNTDGSKHVEEIVRWQPAQCVQLRLCEFSPPLSRLATAFLETWEFTRRENATEVTRLFEMLPKSSLTRPAVWVISLLMRRTVARHLHQLAAADD